MKRMRRRPGELLGRALSILLARVQLRRARLGARVAAQGRVRTRIEGECRIGPRVTFRGGMLPTFIRVHPEARLSIGQGTVFNYGVLLDAHREIRIGDRCMLASGVCISDRDHDRVAPIRIGDDVWIAHGAILAPGITVGDGAVVAAGSVVTADVPAGHLASGNPARAVPLSLISRDAAETAREMGLVAPHFLADAPGQKRAT